MPDYRPLADEQIGAIAQAYYSLRATETDRQDTPTIILVGGQPGAGKTTAAHVAFNDLNKRGGFIHIDTDAFHKRVSGSQDFTSTETHDDCKKIAVRVRALAIAGGRNILEEGLFRHQDALSRRIQEAHDEGYSCEIIAVATSREQSRLSVLERREAFRDSRGYVRDVSEIKQDMGYTGFTENMIRDAAKFDRVRIVNRGGENLYDSINGRGKYGSVYEALKQGRELSDQQIAMLNSQWIALKSSCVEKRIPADELARVDEGRRLFELFKSSEQHRHAMRSLEQNCRVFAADPRFTDYTDAEMTKAAYYRGACIKKQTFAGRSPDMANIDAWLSDQTTLARLPDMPGLKTVEIERATKKQNLTRDSSFER